MQKIIISLAIVMALGSCVSKKSMLTLKSQYDDLQATLDRNKALLSKCDEDKAGLNTDKVGLNKDIEAKNLELKNQKDLIDELGKQIDYLKKNNAVLLDRMSDLSIVSKAGAESIKKSMEVLNAQGQYIKDLNTSIQRKDSLNMALVTNLKRSLENVNDDDVQVEVKKGVVYVSLSDKMLYRQGSYEISPSAEAVLGKVAQILNDYKEIDILIEGHTDNIPYAQGPLLDNWDLSAKRATSVARMLQTKFGVDPNRLTAGGRGQYAPKVSNDSVENRKVNRRTEIVIIPKLDQFFQLAVPQEK